jgi:sterol desaturase/sphingolipid hydroxylase (fatty acid hydroxylase superfamily)
VRRRVVKEVLGQPSGPWTPAAFYLPIAAACILWNVLTGTATWTLIVLPLAGVLLWTFLEYVLHSVPFHRPVGPIQFKSMRESHGSHHEEPTDPERIVAQLTFSVPVALLVYGLLCLGFWGVRLPALVMVGVMVGYLSYEGIHYRIHLGWKSRWLPRALVRHHLYHHHKDSTRCFGVTSPVWDWVFHTTRRPRQRRGATSSTAPLSPPAH